MRVADAIDGRLFALVVMRACASGELGLSADVAAAAQKMAKAAGVTGSTTNKPASCSVRFPPSIDVLNFIYIHGFMSMRRGIYIYIYA